MNAIELTSDWYVAYTKPKSENLAKVNLAQQGFEVYLPLFKKFKKTELGAVAQFEPMFPRYLFFKCSEQQQSLSTVRSTKGVNNLVRFGFEPARLQDKLVALIREMESSRNDITIVQASSFRAGQSVRLKHTALGNVEGLIHNVGAQRIAVLLEILGRPTVVQVEHHQIEAN